MKHASADKRRRGDGQWLAWGASALLMVILSPQIFGGATLIFEAFLKDDIGDRDYAELLVYPIFALCLMTGFFAFALLLRFTPKVGLLAFLRSKAR